MHLKVNYTYKNGKMSVMFDLYYLPLFSVLPKKLLFETTSPTLPGHSPVPHWNNGSCHVQPQHWNNMASGLQAHSLGEYLSTSLLVASNHH